MFVSAELETLTIKTLQIHLGTTSLLCIALRFVRRINRVYDLIVSFFLVMETTFLTPLNLVLLTVILGVTCATGMYIQIFSPNLSMIFFITITRIYLLSWRKSAVTIWAATWQKQQSECAPSEDSDQPGHQPSLIRVFAVRSMGSKGPKLSSCGQRRLWSDWADAQADLSLR